MMLPFCSPTQAFPGALGGLADQFCGLVEQAATSTLECNVFVVGAFVLLLLGLAVLIARSSRKSKVYILDFAVHKPHDR
jgi:hypothetical protein